MCARIVIFFTTLQFALGLGIFAYYFSDLKVHFFPENSPIVETKNGDVQGIIKLSRDGREYFAYLGIPFAQPPIEDLRFEAPLPVKNWDGIRPANKYGSSCYQFAALTSGRILGQEDCLFLNIFTTDLKGSLPVMVWIHGGGFLEGAADLYSPKYFMDHDIVIVTLNYRLGAFGFLNTGDELIKGNMGLKDQTMALKWVQENIATFGGDPNRVTIFGESAGGASVHYHIISSLSRGLFSKAISQSGVVQCPWALTRDAKNQAKYFGNQVGCPTENSEELFKCLKKKDPLDLVQGSKAKFSPVLLQNDMLVGSMEAVAKNDSFLTEYPHDIIKNGYFSHVPWMVGVVSGEGALKTSRVEAMSEGGNLDDKWSEYAPILMHYDPKRTEVTDKIRKFYFNDKNYKENPEEFLRNFTTMISDGMFFHATVTAAGLHAQFAPVYLYYYDYRAASPSLYSILRSITPDTWILSELKFFISAVQDLSNKYIFKSAGPHDYGPCHSDDLVQEWLVNPLLEIRNSNPDITFSKKFIKLLVDFARDEDNLQVDQVPWPPVKPKEPLQFMYLGEQGKIVTNPFSGRMSFIDSLGITDPYEKNNW